MAQVKKLQSGGTLTINGKQYTAEQLNNYINQAGFSSEERASIAGLVNAIASGRNRSLDRNANSVSGENITDDFSSFYGGNEKRMEKNVGRNSRWANRQARRNSDHHVVNSAIAKLGAIEDYETKKKNTPSDDILGRGAGWFERDNAGNYISGPSNMSREALIRKVYDHLSGNKTYTLGGDWGDNMNNLQAWYKAGDTAQTLIDAIKSGNLSSEQIDVLKAMGFDPESYTSEPKAFEGWSGNIDDAKRAGLTITKDSSGNFVISGNDAYTKGAWYGGGLDFLAGTDYADGGIYNGRLYTRDQILANDPSLRGAFDAFINAGVTAKDWRNWYDLANSSGVRFAGDRLSANRDNTYYGAFETQFNPYTHYNKDWSDYFKNLGLKSDKMFDLSNVTGSYNNVGDRQIIAYVDPNNTYDALGIRNLKFAVRNSDGSFQTFNSESEMLGALGLTSKMRSMMVPGEFNSTEWETIGNKRYTLAHELNTQGGQQNVILMDENGKFYLAKKDPSGQHLNPRLIEDEELLQDIITNPQNYDNSDVEDTTKTREKKIRKNTKRSLWSWTANRSPLRKQGGSIPKIKPLPTKFQYGGSVNNAITTSKVENTSDKRTDITSTHKTNGSDGGLTNAEQLQIISALGDLAGIGISLAPGVGNVVGSIAGLGATATGFIADVKKDGFQAKDAWSALGSAILDVATLVPGLGTGAKTAKAVKAIKAAATPIMKVLSLAGAASGAAAMGKVLRGEEITSEDLQAIIRGIGSSVISGKQIKDTIGDAKLAKKLATRAADTANTLKNEEILGDTLKRSRKQISELIEEAGSEKKAVEKIVELLKADNPNATSTDARKVLKEWGVDVSRSRWSGKEGWSKLNPFKKGEKQVSFDHPKDEDAGSTLYYMLNPFARRKQLGFDWGYWQKKGNMGLMTETDVAAAHRAVRMGSRDSMIQSILRQTVDNPRAFNFKLGNASRLNRWGFPLYGRSVFEESASVPTSGPRVVSPAKVTLSTGKTIMLPAPARTVMISAPESTLALGGPESRLMLPAPDRTFSPEITPSLNEFEKLGFFDIAPTLESRTYSRIPLMPNEQGYFVPTNRASKGWFRRNYDPMFDFKNGGKITKYQIPAGPMPVPKLTVDPSFGLTKSPTEIATYGYTSKYSPTRFNYMTGQTEANPYYKELLETPTLNVPSTLNNPEPEIKNETNFASQVGEKPKIDWGRIGGIGMKAGRIAGELGITLSGIDKQLGYAAKNRDIAKSIHTINDPEYYGSFSDNGKKLAYDQAATEAETQASRNVTSDSYRNRLFKKDASAEARNLRLQGRLAQSEVYSNFKDKQDALRAQYAAKRTANLNQDILRHANADASYNIEAGKATALQVDAAKKAIGDAVGIYNDQKLAGLQSEITERQRTLQDWYTKEKANYDSSASIDKTKYPTFENYMESTPILKQGYREHQDALSALQRRATLYRKKGGKMRPTSEQIKIDTEKAKYKAIDRLSKQSFELLKKALS